MGERRRKNFFNSLLVRNGRPCTEVGGRPRVALRTPVQLWICFGPDKTEARATGRVLGADRGKANWSQALMFLAPASSSPNETG